MNVEYKLSGKSGNIFFVGLLLGPIFIALLAIIYAYIDVYNPLVYFTFIVFLGLLFGIVLIQKIVIKLSKCRSETSALIYGTIVGLFGVYINWCTFLFVYFRYHELPIEFLDLMLDPVSVFDMANALSIDGYYSMFGSDIKGFFLWLIWIIEALGIIGAGAVGGLIVLHEEIFCEDCNIWAEKKDVDLRLAIEDQVSAKTAIDSDVTKILEYPIYVGANSEHIQVNLHQCSKCQNTSTIDIDLITYEENDKGEIKEKSEDFSKVFLLNRTEFGKFIAKKTNLETLI
jgi:hypothetical protein